MSHYLGIGDDTNKIQWKDTRLLLYYLLNSEFETDHVKYLKDYINEHHVKNYSIEEILDQLIIRIVPKEKELKVKFRGFGCKSMLDRMRTLAQEKSMSEYMSLYCSEQAMTLSELDILKKLLSFRRIEKAFIGYQPIYLNIDATGWNNYFRHETVSPIMEHVYDKIFDTTGLKNTMIMYENSIIYVPDEFETVYWKGQYGGIEGLNQYTWDLVYLPQVRASLEGIGFEYMLFVKGDDLRVVVLIPPKVLKDHSIDEIRNQIVEKVSVNMKKFGHQLNPAESYGSSKYFTFSKKVSVSMIELPQAFRKIQKTYGANNAFLPFLDDYIGSAFSNAHSACAVTVSPLPCFFVALFWMYYHLLNHSQYSGLTVMQLVVLSFTPSIMGGFPIILLNNMWTRAESDLLTPYIDILQYLRERNPELHQIAISFLLINPIDVTFYPENLIGLLIDPYSLPIKKPSAASTILRRAIKPSLQRIIKNREVIELFQAADLPDMKELIRALHSCNVYNAKFMSAIYSASPAGLLSTLLRKFESGRSILELIILRWGKNRANSILTIILKADHRVNKRRVDTLKRLTLWTKDLSIDLQVDNKCCACIAQSWRDVLWGKPVESITMPAVLHLVKFTDAQQKEPFGLEYASSNHFQYTLHPTKHKFSKGPPFFQSGDHKLFVGFQTRTGLLSCKDSVIDKHDLMKEVRDLLDIYTWTLYNDIDASGQLIVSNIGELITKILDLYAPGLTEKLLQYKATRRNGTISHHLGCNEFHRSIVPMQHPQIYIK